MYQTVYHVGLERNNTRLTVMQLHKILRLVRLTFNTLSKRSDESKNAISLHGRSAAISSVLVISILFHVHVEGYVLYYY